MNRILGPAVSGLSVGSVKARRWLNGVLGDSRMAAVIAGLAGVPVQVCALEGLLPYRSSCTVQTESLVSIIHDSRLGELSRVMAVINEAIPLVVTLRLGRG